MYCDIFINAVKVFNEAVVGRSACSLPCSFGFRPFRVDPDDEQTRFWCKITECRREIQQMQRASFAKPSPEHILQDNDELLAQEGK